jgi:hypothetical protein
MVPFGKKPKKKKNKNKTKTQNKANQTKITLGE